MPTANLEIIQSNRRRERELRGELRQLDEKLTKEDRSPSDAEQALITRNAGELGEIRERVDALLGMEAREQASGAALGPLAHLLDTDTEVRGARAIGNLPPIDFRSDQLHELHEQFMSSRSGSIEANVETRAITATPMSDATGQRLSPVDFRREPARIGSLIPTQQVDSASVTFYTASAAASAAAAVAEGALKPESTPGWTAVQTDVRKLAHWCEVSTEALDDYASFEQVIRQEMVAGLINVENTQLLSGDGVAPNIEGLLNATGIQTYAPVAAEKRLYSILTAITELRTGASFAEADTIVLHPTDWATVARTETADGALIVSPSPAVGTTATLWGVPVVLTSQIAAGTAIVANLGDAAVVFSRMPATLFVDPYSQMTANLVRFVVEERLALGVTRPAAIVAVTFSGTT